MTTLLDAAKQALEALTDEHARYARHINISVAATLLRTAIAEAEKAAPPQREPLTWSNHVEQRMLQWRQRFVTGSGDRLALDDFMDKESLDDLIDFVCDESVGPPQHEPLTFAQGQELLAIAIKHPTIYEEAAFRKGVKAAERAHGIGGSNE